MVELHVSLTQAEEMLGARASQIGFQLDGRSLIISVNCEAHHPGFDEAVDDFETLVRGLQRVGVSYEEIASSREAGNDRKRLLTIRVYLASADSRHGGPNSPEDAETWRQVH
jgi:hypothetical protein